jgi:hypothetical protein
VDPQDVVFTDHKSRPALMLAGVLTWPLQRRWECPPVDHEADAQGLDEETPAAADAAASAAARPLVMPKIKVTWFVLDDRKNSLIRFSIYDPNLSLMQTFVKASRRPQKNKSALRFADSARGDPLQHLRQFNGMHIANTLDENLFEEMYTFLRPTEKFKDVRHTLDDLGDATHISNALTLKRALDILACVNANTHAFARIPWDVAKK